jgi:hypothetical protein
MSRGPGVVQRKILALTKAQPGPWTVEEVRALVYPGDLEPSRSQTNAVSRALKMPLPGKWKVGYVEGDRRRWLYDAGNLDAITERVHRLETFKIIYDTEMTTLVLELSGGDTDDPAYVPIDERKPPEPVD